MSEHRPVIVMPFTWVPHPNADTLSVVHVHPLGGDGWQCVVRTADFSGLDLGAFVEPDSLVPVGEREFAHLAPRASVDGLVRIKAMTLRGVPSQGLLLPPRPHWQIGQDVSEELGVLKWNPPEPKIGTTDAPTVKPPPIPCPTYDLESWRREGAARFRPGEEVVITEKIHGTSARYVWCQGRLHVGTRTRWIGEGHDGHNAWYEATRVCPGIVEFCEARPNVVLYGEVYGVQDLRYGLPRKKVGFVAFDVFSVGAPIGMWWEWESASQAAAQAGVPWVPVLWTGQYDPAVIVALAEGRTTLGGDHVREGIAIRAVEEREPRAHLKLVGQGYLERGR